ncbi:MAG: thiamine pyrophosphate-dependent dehydrogenase E1 component subunit alpha [Chloroflexota bacterium]
MATTKTKRKKTLNHKQLVKKLGVDKTRSMLLDMMTIRAFEEKAQELYEKGLTWGTMHLSIGQEGTAVGASTALTKDDYLLNTHRGHGHCLAWGSEPNLMMAEFMGKETGYCRGRGGSMHIADVDANNLGANGIVAGGVPTAVGVGLSIRARKTDQVCMVVFGDGAANTGAFHEALNMASIWDLPVVFLCENNQYAMSMSFQKAFNIERVSERAAAYNIAGESVDGNDVLAVYDAVERARKRAVEGDGPTLLECLTYRYRGHSRSDRQAYRTRDEVKEWQEKDPIPRFASVMGWKDAQVTELRAEAQKIIDAAVVFAEASPEPDVTTVMEGVYA